MTHLPIIDINGREIKPGDTVKTQQPSGGILPPANPTTGIAEITTDAFGYETLQIRFKKQYRVKGETKDYDAFILLNFKINEVINH